jgi:hypothetical protein
MAVLGVAVVLLGEKIYPEPAERLHHSYLEDQMPNVHVLHVENSLTSAPSKLRQADQFGEF